MAMAETHKSGAGRYVLVYGCILAIAALQFVVAYSSLTGPQMLTRMMILATVEAGLAVLFFMHLWMENHGLLWFVLVITLFVLLALQYGWTDSFRLLDGVPWAK